MTNIIIPAPQQLNLQWNLRISDTLYKGQVLRAQISLYPKYHFISKGQMAGPNESFIQRV